MGALLRPPGLSNHSGVSFGRGPGVWCWRPLGLGSDLFPLSSDMGINSDPSVPARCFAVMECLP